MVVLGPKGRLWAVQEYREGFTSGSSTFLCLQPLPCCLSVPVEHHGQCQVPLAHAGPLTAFA